MVFYRKYRPQTIAELDSPTLKETLKAVLSQKETPHAFLFTGPKGLGKTSTARIIAKVLNCTNPKRNGIEPCNECEQCVSITNGTNIDVLEIDGASNRGIDEIRDLRERVNLAPSAARRKVYIIDEVHMLTTEAFNALLKTIEEPPSHVVFIFATTEPQKVPATIISRCFHISLNRATNEELTHSLKRIIATEHISVDDDALQIIAKLGDGGFRDTQKIFEEIVALSGAAKITKEIVEKHAGIAGVSGFGNELLLVLSKKEAKEALLIIAHIVAQGVDMKLFLFEFLLTLHHLLLADFGVEEFLAQDVHVAREDLLLLIALLEVAYKNSKFAVIQSLPLELAVVEFCQQSPDASEISQEVDGKAENKTKTGVTMKDALKMEQNLKVKQVLSGEKPQAPIKKTTTDHTQENLPKDIADNAVLLENLIYKVKPYNHSVAGVLRSCVVQSVTDKEVVFQTAYVFHKERLDDIKSKEILEKGLKEITGKNLKASIVLKTK